MENISVSVRVRPLNDLEADKGAAWRIENNKIYPQGGQYASDNAYTLDYVFDSQWDTKAVYDRTTEDIIKKVVGGFNGTVFAYGQTSSGKTHTMRGTPTEPGIIPLAVADIFNQINSMQDREFLLRVSYMELYNEDINDLLAMENSKLQIHESKEAGVHVAGLREEIVTGAEHVLNLLSTGEAARHIGETKMNKASSRSHTVFRMVVESRSRDPESPDGGAVWVSTLTLVDLAGSERIAKTGAEGLRMKEGASINKSLLTLGTVINKLSEGVQVQGGHIPYRDSKLTRILQPSLGGNAKTAIICNITPAVVHQEESHSTLRFACRAKRVVNNAMVNEVLSDAAVLKRQAKEIEELRRVLAANGNAAEVEAQIASLRAELLHKEQENERVQLQLLKEREDREKAQRKVDGLTRLMLGAASDDDGVVKSRKENRRETWAPGLAGRGSRKRPLAAQLEGAVDGEEVPPNGRKSEGLLQPMETTSAHESPAHQKRRSSGAVEDISMGPVPYQEGAPAADVATLEERIKELETEQVLMQRELDSVTEAAQRSDTQLRAAEDELMEVEGEKETLATQIQQQAWQIRNLERQLEELRQSAQDSEKETAKVAEQLDAGRQLAEERAAEAEKRAEAYAAQGASLQSDASTLSRKLREAEHAVSRTRQEAAAEKERLERKINDQKEEGLGLEERLKKMEGSVEAGQKAAEELEEKLAKAAERERDLSENNQRLENHISDLESRKRAPLYQKKQEEELRAATEKAQEAEARAKDAELKSKEAKAARHEAERRAHELDAQISRLREEAVAAAEEAAATLEAFRQRAKMDDATLKEAQAEELAVVHRQIETLKLQIQEAEEQHHAATLQQKEKEEGLTSQVADLQSQITALQGCLGETQACAEAAAEHVRSLEDQAVAERNEQLEELAAANAALEAAKQEASKVLKDAVAAHRTQAEGLRAQITAAEGAVEAAEERIEAERLLATSALKEAAEKAVAEHEALHKELAESQATVAELEATVARAAASLKAADELKELRKQHREEVVRLQQQLKSTSASSKGGVVEAERFKKELEKTREKLQAAEGKARNLVQDKNNAVVEKGSLERELKQLKSTAGRLTKDLEKKEAVADKKLEVVSSQLSQARSQLNAAELSVSTLEAQLQQTQAELKAVQDERDSLADDLQTAGAARADIESERDGLRVEAASKTAELEDASAELEGLRAAMQAKSEELSQLAEAKKCLEEDSAALKATEGSLTTSLEALRLELEQCQAAKDTAEGRLPEIDALLAKLESAAQQHSELEEKLAKVEKAAAEKQEEFQAAKAALQSQVEKAAKAASRTEAALKEEKSTLEFQIQEAEVKLAEAISALAERTASETALKQEMEAGNKYQQEIEGQLNEAELQNQTLKVMLEDSQSQRKDLAARLDSASESLAEKQAALAEQSAQLANLQEQAAATRAELEGSLKASQVSVSERATRLERLEQDKAASDADWESRLQEAVDSAEQWKAFAEKLGKEKGELEALLADLQKRTEVLQQEADGLRTRETEATAAAQAARQGLEALRTGNSRVQSQYEDAMAQVRTLEAAAEEGARLRLVEAQEAHRMLQSRTAALDAARQDFADMQEAGRELEEQLAHVKAAHSDCREREERLRGEATLVHADLARLRLQLEHTATVSGDSQQATPAQLAAERKVAELHGKLHSQESRMSQLSEECRRLRQQSSAQTVGCTRCPALESDLRKSKRAEAKLHALQFRTRNDLEKAGGDVRKLDHHKSLLQLEYELDLHKNRSKKEIQALKEELAKSKGSLQQPSLMGNKENAG